MNKYIFLILSLLFTIVFTYRLEPGQFLFLNDQLFPFSINHTAREFAYIIRSGNLGRISSWQSIIQFWDSAYFLIIYYFKVNFIWAEKIHFFITLFITFNFSYVGLTRLAQLYFLKLDRYKIFLVGLFYCFNPYTLALWHGGVYNIGSALTYSLAPLIIYYFHLSVFEKSGLRTRLKCAITLFFASFVFWMFAVVVYVLIIYTAIFLIFRGKQKIKLYLLNLSKLAIMYIPLASIVILNIMYKYINITGSKDPMAQPGYGNQVGGLLYQLKFLFSWGIYTLWTPRTLYFFGSHFFSGIYNFGVILLYVFLIVGIIFIIFPRFIDRLKQTKLAKRVFEGQEKINYRYLLVFIFIFAISIFFAKAQQPPFGGIFVYLYENLPLFSVFRNADIRFGFAVILCLAIISLFSSRFFHKGILAVIMVTVILTLSWNLINGSAVMGLDTKIGDFQYIDRIVKLPDEYLSVADKINSAQRSSAYVLSIPAFQAGIFNLGKEGTYIGPDLLPKIVERDFLYVSSDSAEISTITNNKLIAALEAGNANALNDFPIKYIVYRKEIDCSSCYTLSKETLDNNFNLIEENSLVALYEIENSVSVVDSPKTLFQQISPVKYTVNFENLMGNQDLTLWQSYSPRWKLFLVKNSPKVCGEIINYGNNSECSPRVEVINFSDVEFLLGDSVSDDTHKYANDYANQWNISSDYIRENFSKDYYSENGDGSIDFQLVIYYKDQAWYLLTLLISGALLIIYVGFLVFIPKNSIA